MKKYTVMVLNEETQEAQRFEFDGFVMGGVVGRKEKRFQIGVTAVDIGPEEAAQVMVSLKNEHPEIRSAEQAVMMQEVFGRLGVTTDEDDCDCDVCTSRREAEGADIQ